MNEPNSDLFPDLATYVTKVQAEAEMIPAERKAALEQLAGFIGKRGSAGETAKLVFICTHNSRRSHLAQIWAETAAQVYGVSGVETYSGGTEATAFNPRAVAALERAGFGIDSPHGGDNPIHTVRFSESVPAMECFSKVYDHPLNPNGDFCAVMTCGAADAGCPVVFGAAQRIAITYEDPKAADGSPEEERVYDERCRQIAREMLYAISQV